MTSRQLSELVRLIVEKKVREAQLSGGRITEWGSDDHIEDLQARWYDMCSWRDKYPKGSEQRANYARLANRLKTELKSAERHKAKKKILEEMDED